MYCVLAQESHILRSHISNNLFGLLLTVGFRKHRHRGRFGIGGPILLDCYSPRWQLNKSVCSSRRAEPFEMIAFRFTRNDSETVRETKYNLDFDNSAHGNF